MIEDEARTWEAAADELRASVAVDGSARRYEDMDRAELIALVQSLEAERRDEREISGFVARLNTLHEEAEAQNEQLLEAQAQLEGSLLRYSDLYDFAPIGHATVDRYGVIEEINLTCADLLGRERKVLVGQLLARFVRPSDQPKLLEHLRRCRRTAGPVTTELVLWPRPGEEVPVQLCSRPTVGPGAAVPASFRTAFVVLEERLRAEEALRRTNEVLEERVRERTDALEKANRGLQLEIRERKELEGKLREQARALEEADRRKDEFLAMLGHELRNPLAPIVSAVALLRGLGSSSEPGARALAVIDRQLLHLVKLVDDLLDVARITRGKIQIQEEPISLRDLIQRALETARPAIEAGHHEIDVHIPDEQIDLHVDPVRITQVVANLLNNAAKYTTGPGRLSLSGERDDDEVRLSVGDNGEGIPPEIRDHIFDPFFQGGQALDRARGGLGLGLTLSRRIAELHGGTIRVESGGAGRGSVFTVGLPATRARVRASGHDAVSQKPEAHAGSPTIVGRLRVLIVDDNVDAADNLAALTEALGHDAIAVYDGAAALEAMAAFSPDLVLLDVGLPTMDGYEVARRIRHDFTARPLKIFAVTGYGEAEARRRTREAGFDEHIVKPLGLKQLQILLASAPA